MNGNLDFIKGLILRIDQHTKSRKGDKKIASKMQKILKQYFNAIFTEENDEIFKNDFNELISSIATSPYIISNFFPSNPDEYGKYASIFTFTNDFKFELRWMVFCLKHYSDKISTFLSSREKYDNCVLLNKYEDALEIINTIEKKLGVSLWSMECKFYIYSKLGKDMNELFKDIPNTAFGAIANFYELKNRENVTSDEYFYIVEKEINNLKRRDNRRYNANIELYKYCIESIIYQANPSKFLALFESMRYTSLIDKYLFLIDVFDFAILCEKESSFYKTIQKYILELSEINDDHLIALRFIFDTNDNRKNNYVLKNRLDKAKTEFIEGNLHKARKSAVELLSLFPNNIEAINLYIDTNILLGQDAEEFDETNIGILLKKLQSVYTLSENRDDDIDAVNKFINSCSQSTWAKSVRNSIVHRCQVYGKEDYGIAEILTNLQHLDVETMVTSLPKDECIDYIAEKSDSNDTYISFRKALLEGDYESAKAICNIEQIRDLLDVCNENKSIDEKISHLRQIKGVDAAIAIMAMKYFLATVNLEDNPEIILQVSTELIIENIYTSLFIPLEKIVNYIDDADDKIRSNICSPILYYVYTYYFKKDKMDDLGIICEDFFRFEGIETPKKMNIYKYDKDKLIYFLRYVCDTKVMDISVTFKNTQERDQERVEICNILSEIDSSNVKEYEEEIRTITQKLMINRELKTIEENRIHVNIDGIKERLTKAHKNDFIRYMFYQNDRIIQFTMLKESEKIESIKFIQDAPERIFRELVFHIRDAFVSSDEYGLNGYLSLNFRHGTMEDELRSPLSKAMLTAKKDITTNNYTINKHWLNSCQGNDLEIVRKAIAQFHIETEAIITKLKNKYIQIRTEEKHTEGIFDYRLYEQDFLVLSISASKCSTFDEFLDTVINYLWKITEKNLLIIKEIIKTEILEDYTNAFNRLKVNLAEVNDKNRLRELQQKINESSTEMQNVLDRICYWFQRSTESKHSDFDLQFAFDLGLLTIKNMHREVEFTAIRKEDTESDMISGTYLKNFNDIFYNLFDNIYKKAYWKNGREIEIRYSLKNTDGKVRIYIENDIDKNKNLTDDIARVEETKQLIASGEYIKRVKGEGGTGIPKICKIIFYDLGYHFFIDFGYHIQKRTFFMEIEFGKGVNGNFNY